MRNPRPRLLGWEGRRRWRKQIRRVPRHGDIRNSKRIKRTRTKKKNIKRFGARYEWERFRLPFAVERRWWKNDVRHTSDTRTSESKIAKSRCSMWETRPKISRSRESTSGVGRAFLRENIASFREQANELLNSVHASSYNAPTGCISSRAASENRTHAKVRSYVSACLGRPARERQKRERDHLLPLLKRYYFKCNNVYSCQIFPAFFQIVCLIKPIFTLLNFKYDISKIIRYKYLPR